MFIRCFILTGAPGSGKTSTIQVLRGRGHATVDEAATDLIAAEQARGIDEPWVDPGFIDKIAGLQRDRQLSAVGDLQFYDRSPVCTLALARLFEQPPTAVLTAEIERMISERIYEREVFFLRPLGFIVPTAVRQISYSESLRFEKLHEEEYLRLGFTLVDIWPADPEARATAIGEYVDEAPRLSPCR